MLENAVSNILKLEERETCWIESLLQQPLHGGEEGVEKDEGGEVLVMVERVGKVVVMVVNLVVG